MHETEDAMKMPTKEVSVSTKYLSELWHINFLSDQNRSPFWHCFFTAVLSFFWFYSARRPPQYMKACATQFLPPGPSPHRQRCALRQMRLWCLWPLRLHHEAFQIGFVVFLNIRDVTRKSYLLSWVLFFLLRHQKFWGKFQRTWSAWWNGKDKTGKGEIFQLLDFFTGAHEILPWWIPANNLPLFLAQSHTHTVLQNVAGAQTHSAIQLMLQGISQRPPNQSSKPKSSLSVLTEMPISHVNLKVPAFLPKGSSSFSTNIEARV